MQDIKKIYSNSHGKVAVYVDGKFSHFEARKNG